MPQTSPMNWTILSFSMIMLIFYLSSFNNEKINYNLLKEKKFKLKLYSWKW